VEEENVNEEPLSHEAMTDIARDAVALVLATERKDLAAYAAITHQYDNYDDLLYLSIMLSKFVISAIRDFLEIAGANKHSVEEILQCMALEMALRPSGEEAA
jgi:hypothetical protein